MGEGGGAAGGREGGREEGREDLVKYVALWGAYQSIVMFAVCCSFHQPCVRIIPCTIPFMLHVACCVSRFHTVGSGGGSGSNGSEAVGGGGAGGGCLDMSKVAEAFAFVDNMNRRAVMEGGWVGGGWVGDCR